MVVLCNGMPRSGSTWSFNVIKAVLRHGYPGEEIQGGPSEAPIQFLKELSPGARHAVIKCHSLTPACRALARTRAVKIVFTTRDLGDAVASGVDAFRMSFERVLDFIGPSLELLSFHRSTGNAAIVCYEQVVHDPEAAVRRIAEYLTGYPVPTAVVRVIAAETSFERMREKVSEIEAADDSTLVNTGPNSYDPETMLYRRHMADGRTGKGRDKFTPAQLARLDALVQKFSML